MGTLKNPALMSSADRTVVPWSSSRVPGTSGRGATEGVNLVLGYTRLAQRRNFYWLCPSFTSTAPTVKVGSTSPGITLLRTPSSTWLAT